MLWPQPRRGREVSCAELMLRPATLCASVLAERRRRRPSTACREGIETPEHTTGIEFYPEHATSGVRWVAGWSVSTWLMRRSAGWQQSARTGTRGVVVNFDLGERFPRPRSQQRCVAMLKVGARRPQRASRSRDFFQPVSSQVIWHKFCEKKIKMGRIDIGTKWLPACRIDSSGWLW